MECNKAIFSGHAVRRMFERSISRTDVLNVIASGKIIAHYPDDAPFPSYLMLNFIRNRAIHAVIGHDQENLTCYIVTAYPPDLLLWNADFETRR